jgi:hypothetical protein
VESAQSSEYSYICVLSYPRSGSQTLCNILNTCEDIKIYSENNGFILDLLNFNIKARSTAGMLDYEDFHLSKTHFNYDMNISNLRRDTLEFINKNLFNCNKKIKGWKESNISTASFSEKRALIYIQEISNIFPNCLFIYNIRDPMTASKSGKWRHVQNSYLLLNKWRDFYIDCYESSIVNNSILLDYDIWNNNFDYLSDKLNFIDLNNDLTKNVFFEKSYNMKYW